MVTGSATKEYRNEIVERKKIVPRFLVRVNCIVGEVTRLYELHLEHHEWKLTFKRLYILREEISLKMSWNSF